MAGTPGSVADVLTTLLQGNDLSPQAATWMMDLILSGNATSAQIAGFAVALRSKGETVEEISGLAAAMLQHATPIEVPGRTVDIVGSGGDRARTVNVSTMAGLVAASAGARVVKHGNRAASSACGAADVVEALGVNLDVDPADQAAVVEACGICFLFAAKYHPSLRHAGGPRRELGVPTTFNFLGPLTNPARPAGQAIGVADERMAGLMAGVLAGRGADGLVFHGGDGLDELTTTTSSRVWLIADGQVSETTLEPLELGLARATPDDLVGGDPDHNAQVVRDLVAGRTGPVRDIVVLNAAAALLAHRGLDREAELVPQLAEQVAIAQRAIDDGSTAQTLDRWVVASNN